MHEVTINSKTFRLTDVQVKQLNDILSNAMVKKAYTQEYVKNVQEIVTVSITRWSNES